MTMWPGVIILLSLAHQAVIGSSIPKPHPYLPASSYLQFLYDDQAKQTQQQQPTMNNNKDQNSNIRRALKTESQTQVREYTILESRLIQHMMLNMAKTYPDFAILSSSQEEFGLAAAGDEDDCPFDHADDGTRRHLQELHEMYVGMGRRGFDRILRQMAEGDEGDGDGDGIGDDAQTGDDTPNETDDTPNETDDTPDDEGSSSAPSAAPTVNVTTWITWHSTLVPDDDKEEDDEADDVDDTTNEIDATDDTIEEEDDDNEGNEDAKTDTDTIGCHNWFLTIQDTLTHPLDSPSSKLLPEIFLSGAVHGNERVGPTVVLEAALTMLYSAHCESLPHGSPPLPEDPQDWHDEWDAQVKEAEDCRTSLRENGVNDGMRKWLARLVTTRRIVILPTANALGYYQNEREENGIDPNRDFPFDLKDNEECMRSIAARTINEIFRQHMFQLSITFHSGSSSITYEWGAPHYDGKLSPDDEAQKQLVGGYVKYAGAIPKHQVNEYDSGTMNDVVYPVRGGMEDWAYAGSWDDKRVKKCHPDTYGGYNGRKTHYDRSTLRTFNTLVETSDWKTPPDVQLGTDKDIFDPESSGNGHIPRNIRLALMAADVVEPYLVVQYIHDVPIEDDIVPLRRRDRRSCVRTKRMQVPLGNGQTRVEWTVGGGFNVDETALVVAKWSDLPEEFDGFYPPTGEILDDLVYAIEEEEYGTDRINVSPTMDGKTRWHTDGAFPETKNKDPYGGPLFSTSMSLDNDDFEVGEELAVFAYARMDKYWTSQPYDVEPDVAPQSHLVNARTNPDWSHDRGNQTIQGRTYWFSVPVTIVVGEEGSPIEELSERLPVERPLNDFVKGIETDIEAHMGLIIAFGTMGGVFLCLLMYIIQKRIRYGVVVDSAIEMQEPKIPTETIT